MTNKNSNDQVGSEGVSNQKYKKFGFGLDSGKTNKKFLLFFRFQSLVSYTRISYTQGGCID